MGKSVRGYDGSGIGLDSHTLVVIKLPDSRALRIISRSLFMAVVLLALPSIGSIIGPPSVPGSSGISDLPVVFRDLADEGLIKKGDEGLALGLREGFGNQDFDFLREAGIHLLTGAGHEGGRAFDFLFVPSFDGILSRVSDGTIRDGGLVVSTLGVDPSDHLRLLTNFKIVYLRRFESTVIAMRKMSSSVVANPGPEQVSCGFVTPEKKKVALKGLEDVYLEPPRPAKRPSLFTSRKIKFLLDLLKDSLGEYPRRVFVSDDSRALDWFYKNYPMRNQEFEVYRMEVGGLGARRDGRGMESDWMTKNVGPEDYVVMKAEAGAVEEMLEKKTLCLVDELFLECKNQWQDREEENGSKRAYWQCLALYGKVRDEGIAVHQWWY